MKQQHDDLERLEAMDAELNSEPVLSEVDKILKKPASTFGLFSGRTGSGSSSTSARRGNSGLAGDSDFTSLNLDDLNIAAAVQRENDDSFGAEPVTARSVKSSTQRNTSFGGTVRRGAAAPPSPGGATPPASAPDAQARYAKAKVKQLEAALAYLA